MRITQKSFRAACRSAHKHVTTHGGGIVVQYPDTSVVVCGKCKDARADFLHYGGRPSGTPIVSPLCHPCRALILANETGLHLEWRFVKAVSK